MDDISENTLCDEALNARFAAKDPRPFISAPCPTCGAIGGFLVNPDGSRYPDQCIPCGERRHA